MSLHDIDSKFFVGENGTFNKDLSFPNESDILILMGLCVFSMVLLCYRCFASRIVCRIGRGVYSVFMNEPDDTEIEMEAVHPLLENEAQQPHDNAPDRNAVPVK